MTFLYSTEYLTQNQPTAGREVVDEAIAEFPEFTWQDSVEDARIRILDSIEDLPERVEITARTQNGTLVGLIVVASDDDSQVGEVLGVQWNFVSADYRGPVGTQLMREARRVGKRSGFNIIAYTHRSGEGRYELKYRRLK